jgi:DNA-binding CsgD family transcriptional regulator
MHWWNGNRTEADASARAAIEALADVGHERLLAMALSNHSQLLSIAYRSHESIAVGERAAALARRVGDQAVLSHALTNIGMSRGTLGEPTAYGVMDEALNLALSAGETEHALRAYIAICSALLDDFRLLEAERRLMDALELATRSEQEAYLSFLRLERARLRLYQGRWEDLSRDCEPYLDSAQPGLRWGALLAVGRMQVRRGQPGGDAILRQAETLAEDMAELQRLGPVAAARAESAWLRGDLSEVRRVVEPAYREARELDAVAIESELGFWLSRAGGEIAPPQGAHPYAVLARGESRDAARAFGSVGAPYERALAAHATDDPVALLEAIETLHELEATPLARVVRRRLRDLGVVRVPRGPTGATRARVAGLTGRQAEVLRLLEQGRTNAEIADELVVSVRTVETHVAAVLDKLGVHTRRDAARIASELLVGAQGDAAHTPRGGRTDRTV